MSERTSSVASLELDEQYRTLEEQVSSAPLADTNLFETDADPDALWYAYLNNLPEERRQHYNCHSCRRFIQRYGGLVSINLFAGQTSVIWGFTGPEFFRKSVQAMRDLVSNAKVTGIFYSKEKFLGLPRTGDWTHLSVKNPSPHVSRVKSPEQLASEKLEDYKMLCRGLADYSRGVVEQAVRILKADALYRSEKTLGVAEWFVNLHKEIADKPTLKRNITWAAVASAPPGFCHVRSTMISTLLDDIVAGLDFDAISKRWKEKMHPLQYQRPTAPLKSGVLQQAEELVAKLGLEQALVRRAATLDDVLCKLWVPKAEPEKAKNGVFGHLREDLQKAPVELPAVNKITWEKFARTVLPDALRMQIMVPAFGSFCGLTTAVADAPPILQWDGLEGHPRNPVAWYYYHGGSTATRWNLQQGWRNVTCVFPAPPHWQEPDKFKHQARRIHFAIEGCHDTKNAGLGLFPENMKAELHGIRAVIEAHSNRSILVDSEQGSANGLTMDANRADSIRLRVTTSEGVANYIIDRLD